MNRFFTATLILSLFYAQLAVAQTAAPTATPATTTATPQEKNVKKPSVEDVIYRVNLGRASDISILIKQGASADEVDKSGVPIISLAAKRSDNEGLGIVKVLVEAGADVNKTDKRGQNALFYAAKTGNVEVAKYLLSKNIQYTSVDSSGDNARIIAYQTGNHKVADVMDEFVRQQNMEAQKKYEEANKILQKQQQTINETAKQLHEQKAQSAQEAKFNRVQELVNNFSFANCAHSYWIFCSVYKQQTELGTTDLANNIRSQADRSQEIRQAIVDEKGIDESTIREIASSSREQIEIQLRELLGTPEALSTGIGTLDDMNRRCGAISSGFKASQAPSEETPAY